MKIKFSWWFKVAIFAGIVCSVVVKNQLSSGTQLPEPKFLAPSPTLTLTPSPIILDSLSDLSSEIDKAVPDSFSSEFAKLKL